MNIHAMGRRCSPMMAEEIELYRKCTIVLWLILLGAAAAAAATGSAGRSAAAAAAAGNDVDTCYVSHAGCKYRVVVRAVAGGECGMSNDDPNVSSNAIGSRPPHRSSSVAVVVDPTTDSSPPPPPPAGVDLAASVRKIENLEQTLVRMMEGLSQRSLRHIRQIKTDLRHMTETMDHLKAKTNGVNASPLTSNPGVGGGGGGGGGSGNGVGRKGNAALVCPTEFIGGGTWPSCYRFSAFNASWHEAREYCNAFEANLVSLDTVKEAYIIDYLLKSTPEYQDAKGWWTSGNYIVRSQKWMWTSRQHLRPIVYSRWAPGEPNARSTMHCLLLYKHDKYQWHDGTCTDKHAFVCEIEL